MTTIINAATSGGLIQTADTSGVLQLQTASTAALTVDASQNVGIGTTSPTSVVNGKTLQISASNRPRLYTTTTGTNAVNTFFGSSDDLVCGQIDVVSNHPLVIYTNDTERMRIDSSGNVGIGNTAPADRLQIEKASANCLLSVSRTTGGAGGRLVMQHTDSVGALQTTASVPLTFGTNDTERMRIDSSGFVRINNTSNATYQAQLNIYSPSTNNCAIHCRTNTSGTQSQIIFGNSTNDAVGSITTNSSSTLYNTSSDYRLKENIAPMTGALATVSALKPVTYKWKVDGSNGQGFIAHELQAIVPDCVTGEKDGVETVDELDEDGKVIGTKEVPKYQGIDTSFLVATLTAAIQEQQALITDLTTRLAALEGAK
jgi:hypothetical protein